MCSLCRDTFSRSDILKRHFQKCSIRRGNPTGLSHLTHASYNSRGDCMVSTAALDNNLHTVAISSGQSSPFTPYQFATHDSMTPHPDRGLNDLMNARSTLSLYHPTITTATQPANLEA